MSEPIQRFFSWSAILLVLVVPFLMLILMAMPMDHSMGGCPFMQGEASLCSMSILDHLTNWQQTFAITLVEVLTFAIPVLAVAWLWLTVLKPERPPGYRRRFYPAPPLLQELFSSGILHPKAP
ncbi:MAG: hypothetical protein ABA06_01325 [Parcubacteria bacterium C7867-001]|nr:MAG: hypothetical protein ABA06_01325 [Parcubacteria bacterium C7867-001]